MRVVICDCQGSSVIWCFDPRWITDEATAKYILLFLCLHACIQNVRNLIIQFWFIMWRAFVKISVTILANNSTKLYLTIQNIQKYFKKTYPIKKKKTSHWWLAYFKNIKFIYLKILRCWSTSTPIYSATSTRLRELRFI